MLRWGIISAANINSKFIPPVLESERSKLVAIASRSLEKAETQAKKWNIPKVYTSYEELISDKEVDAVYIPLPNSMHVEWAVRAAAKGLHCLVEKPMALDGDGVRQIATAMTQNKVVIEEAFVHLHHPMLYTVREEMKSLGRITHLTGQFLTNMLGRGSEALVFQNDLGSGAIWMLGTYPISAFIFLVNQRPVSVCAQYKLHESGVDETMGAVLKFPNGVIASMTTSVAAEADTRLEVFGEHGCIRLDRKRTYHVGQSEGNHQFDVVTPDGVRTVAVSTEGAFPSQLRRFEEAVLDGKAPAVSMDVSEWVADTLAACVRSAKEEKFVRL